MRGEGFEYEIRRDVRNNPIVREIDRVRHREMWRSVTIGIFLVAVLVFSVWRRMGLISEGYSVDELQDRIAGAERMNDRLRLEIEMLRSPARIDDRARRDLDMITPGLEDQGVIERAVPDPLPPRSVVASR